MTRFPFLAERIDRIDRTETVDASDHSDGDGHSVRPGRHKVGKGSIVLTKPVIQLALRNC